MAKFGFSCGCRFDVEKDDTINFKPNVETLRLDCPKAWDLICDGNTKGCFQLESRLGQSLAKKTKPRTIEELSALVSIMRPGCMEAMVEGKSLTNHYIDRKHGREPVDYFHPALEEILSETYGILVYQEQSMHIARKIAGFDLQEADVLRKAIGKKKVSEMAKVKTMFLSGAEKMALVTEEQAEEIFGWIEKSQRYSFNKSHAVSYAMNAYLSAYAKCHFDKEFFTSYLFYAKEKAAPHEEISELIANARLMDIDVMPPDMRMCNKNFLLANDNIYFGLSDIKNVGQKVIEKVSESITEVEQELGKEINKWSWLEFLVFFSKRVNSSAMKAMISVGALGFINSNRTRMLYEYEFVSKLTAKELNWLKQHLLEKKKCEGLELLEVMKTMTLVPLGRSGAIANKRRLGSFNEIIKSLESPPFKLEDFPEWIASKEELLLGIPLTCTKVDACDTSSSNCCCRDIANKNLPDYPLVAVEVNSVREITIKNGANRGNRMAFVQVSDSSASIDCVVFSDSWHEFSGLLSEGNTVMIGGKKNRDEDGLVIEKVWQI
jgi:DNA polymerase III alpha subunit